MSEPRERIVEAWHQFLASAVSDGAEPHEVFAWAYLAGWAHDKWPAIADVVPPPEMSESRTACAGIGAGKPPAADGPHMP